MIRASGCRLSFLLFIAGVCVQITLAQQITKVISGRVIDSNGGPVANASVSLYSQAFAKDRAQGLDRIIPVLETDIDGRFRFSQLLASNSQLTLYVTTRVPPNSDAPLRPPFLDLSGASLFSGVPIQVGGKSEIDVGDVPIKIHYKTLIVRMRDSSEMNVLKARDDRLLWLRVRDLHGDVVAWGAVSEKAINQDESLMSLALPQGVWDLDVSLEGSNGPWSSIAKPVEIDPMAPGNLSVSLTFSDRGQNKSRQRDQSGNATRDQALQQLAALGIHYDVTSFIEHAGKCNAKAVQLFLLADMSPNVTRSDGTTALVMASAQGCGEVAKTLLDAGADPNLSNHAGTSPLAAAVASGTLSAVETLLAKNANPNSRDEAGLTPVIIAAGNSRLEILNALLKANADVNSKDNKGMTALDYAVLTGDREVLDALKSAGARSGRQ